MVTLLLAAGLGGRGSSVDCGGSRGRGAGGGGSRGRNCGGGSSRGSSSRSSGGSRGSSGSRGGGAGGRGAGGTEGQARTRDGVGGEVGVKVEKNSSLVLGVEGGTEGTIGLVSAGASDLQIEALGVVLSTVLVSGAVKSNDLVTENVVTSRERRGDGDVPGEVVFNQLIGSPGTWVRAADQTRLVNLDPGQGGLVDSGGIISRGNVGDNGTVVRVGPGVPGSSDGTTCSDGCIVQFTVGSVLVANDVGGAVGIRGNVAVVRGRLGPGVELVASIGTGRNSPLLVETSEGTAIDGPRGYVAVSTDEAGTSGQSQNDGSLGRHV